MRDRLNLWDQMVVTEVSGKSRLDCSYTNPGGQFLKLTTSKLICFEGLFRPNVPQLRGIGVNLSSNFSWARSILPISSLFNICKRLILSKNLFNTLFTKHFRLQFISRFALDGFGTLVSTKRIFSTLLYESS